MNRSVENTETAKENNGEGRIAETGYRVNFATNKTMLFQLLDTIAVTCRTTIRLICERKISRIVAENSFVK